MHLRHLLQVPRHHSNLFATQALLLFFCLTPASPPSPPSMPRSKVQKESCTPKGSSTLRFRYPRYPFQPLSVTFTTPIYHPNIDIGGWICLDILNLHPNEAWQPSLNISTVLTSIGLLLSEPNPNDGLMCEASREFKYNRQAFDQKARSMTQKYAQASASGSVCDSQSQPPSSANPLTVLLEVKASIHESKHEVEESSVSSNKKSESGEDMERTELKESDSTELDNGTTPDRSTSMWLVENFKEMDQRIKQMMKLIKEDGDSLPKNDEAFSQKKPELVEEFHRMYRSLAGCYEHLTKEAHKGFGDSEYGFDQRYPLLTPDAKHVLHKSGHQVVRLDISPSSDGSSPALSLKNGSESSSSTSLGSEPESLNSPVSNYLVPPSNVDLDNLR
ncbi:hypothetical protein ACFX2A_044586 [Malus domestica]